MFTGIIEELGSVRRIRTTSSGGSMTIGCDRVMDGTKNGDSIAVNGTCLTVTSRTDHSFDVDMAPETLSRTSLGALSDGDPVNLERSLSPQSRMGGHFVQGHVDATGTIESFRPDGDSVWVRIGVPSELMRYIVPKGYVALDGVSLTVVDVFEAAFTVMLVPFTQSHITLPKKSVGDSVNIEVDILAKYVERSLAARTDAGGAPSLDREFLKEHGYG